MLKYKKTVINFIYDLMVFVCTLDEWNNFMERLNCKKASELWDNEENVLHLRHWASLRGQTLSRTGNCFFKW